MASTHDFTATLQFGIVSAVDEAGHNLRVKLPALENMETDWLPMLTPAAGGNQFYCLPDEGEQVVCILDAQGESGVVLGATYNAVDKPPASSKDKWVRRFKNGTTIEHDRTSGNVLVKTSGKVTIDAPDTDITGEATIHGLLTYLGGMSAGNGGGGSAAEVSGVMNVTGDVVINGVSMTGHVHPDLTSGGKTGKPE